MAPSASSSARSRSASYVTQAGSCPRRHASGMSVGGPESVMRAPSGTRVWMSERATRLCRTSPTMTIRFPCRSPSAPRSVYASSSPCVGCACHPSPALMTAASLRSATKYGAPDDACRITTTSPPSACSVRTVSRSVSPFSTLEPLALIVVTSAESAFAASSNDTRVRVDASAKKRITVFPRRGGALRTGRLRISTIAPLVSRTASISSRVQSSVSSTWRRVQRGADRAAGEEHIVDEHDDLVVDGEVERGFVHDGRVPDAREVVAVERDVERAERYCDVLVNA